MTHAAHSHDALDAIDQMRELRDRIDNFLAIQDAKEQKTHEALVLANAVALLTKISRQSRTSDSDRQAAKTIAEQLKRGAA